LRTAIALNKATLSYDTLEVLRDITLDVPEGEFVFIMGNHGKSSLLKLMGGIEEPQRGSVLYGEENPYKGSDRKRSEVLKQTGHLLQDAALLANLSMFENTALPLRYHTRLSEEEIQARVSDIFSLLEIQIQADLRPAVFPLGARKMVALARALITEPRLLFLDDPSSGLDFSAKEKMIEILLNMKQRKEITAVFVTEDTSLIAPIADRVLILHEGTIIADDAPDAIPLSGDPRVRAIVNRIRRTEHAAG